MLKEILSPKTCAKCRLCCSFDRDDSWENPVISEKTAEIVKEQCKKGELLTYGEKSYRFALSFNDEGLAYCPALTEKGCCLDDNAKPFDCKIWPYRVMRKGDKLVIVLSPVCESMTAMDFSRTKTFGEKIAKEIFMQAEENPDIIKEYIEGYPIVAEK